MAFMKPCPLDEQAEKHRQEADLKARGWEQDSVGRWFPPATEPKRRYMKTDWTKPVDQPLLVARFSDEDHYEDRRRKTRGGAWPEKYGTPIRRIRVNWPDSSDDFKDLTET